MRSKVWTKQEGSVGICTQLQAPEIHGVHTHSAPAVTWASFGDWASVCGLDSFHTGGNRDPPAPFSSPEDCVEGMGLWRPGKFMNLFYLWYLGFCPLLGVQDSRRPVTVLGGQGSLASVEASLASGGHHGDCAPQELPDVGAPGVSIVR